MEQRARMKSLFHFKLNFASTADFVPLGQGGLIAAILFSLPKNGIRSDHYYYVVFLTDR